MPRVILLVEDNENDELLTLRALKAAAAVAEIIVARDGEAALNYLFARGEFSQRNTHELPQLVILDLNIPKIDGMGVLEALRKSPDTKMLPIVILTSSKDQRDIEKAYALGVNAYVQKPISSTEFTKTCEAIGAFWLNSNQNYYMSNAFSRDHYSAI